MPTLQAHHAAVRLLPAPPLEPPFDDELSPQTWLMPPDVGAQLTLEWSTVDASSVRGGPGSTGDPAGAGHAGRATGAPATSTGAVAGASADALLAAGRFLGRCVEIFNGYRPAGHIRPMSSPTKAQAIVEELAGVARRTLRLGRAVLPAAARSAAAGQSRAVVRRRLRVCEPRPGAAEAAAVLSQAGRAWAVAFRLERHQETWLCTAFVDLSPAVH